MNPQNVMVYTVVFDDGTIRRIYGMWADHARLIAAQLVPDKKVVSVELESPDTRRANNLTTEA